MSTKRIAMLTGLSAIDTAIRDVKGIQSNLVERVQQLACSIINHDLHGGKGGEPSGDVSRAAALVNVLSSAEHRRFMVQFLAYFGNIAVRIEKGYATKAGHIAADSKRFRKPDLDGAKANDWSQPYDANGKKADWYEGPNPNVFVSGTMGDLGDTILKFAKRVEDNLSKTKDDGTGQEVPLYALTADERTQVTKALTVLQAVGNSVMAADVTERMKPFIEQGGELLAFAEKINPPKQDASEAKETHASERTANEDEEVTAQAARA
jgi:hypothetical protein